MAGSTGFVAFYVSFIVLVGIFGYFSNGALGVGGYSVDAPELVIPATFEPTELGDIGILDVLEAIIDFLAWLGYIIVFVIANIGFGIELIIYLLALQGLTNFGLPTIWAGALGTILLTMVVFVSVKTWKGG